MDYSCCANLKRLHRNFIIICMSVNDGFLVMVDYFVSGCVFVCQKLQHNAIKF